MPRLVLINARIATMDDGSPAIFPGHIAAESGRITHVAPGDAPAALLAGAEKVLDCENRLVTPGLIDCHTHLVHGGHRADEFEKRLEGISYEEIARTGGGIASSVRATRAASVDDLIASALPRLDRLIAEGVTTVEIKSGYGLNLAAERAMLTAARALGQRRNVTIKTSFLGAHALPPGETDKDAYIECVVTEMLPALAAEGLVDAVDGFCEGIAFSPAQIARVFDTAKSLGLPVKLHADQLSDLNGAALAARYGALSADHLEYTNESGAAAMAASGTVAVMLPGAFYMLRETRVPLIASFRAHTVPMAVATDCNPGTAPLTSLLLAMNMAATLFRMTVRECWLGTTINAAKALGLGSETGSITIGKSCDLAIWDAETPAELVYRLGFNPLHKRIWKGAVA